MSDVHQDFLHQPIVAHLHELKRRLIYAVLAFAITGTASFFMAGDILQLLLQPLKQANPRPGFHLIFTQLPEAFMAHLEIAVFAGFVLAFPIIAAQVWIFIAPGLYKREKATLVPYFFGAPLLFCCGAALAYFLVMPVTWKFFLSYESGAGDAIPVLAQTRVEDYLQLTMHFIIAFGLVFQLPLLLLLLGQLGIVTATQLKKIRRYAIVVAFVAAAFITPTPDMFGQTCVALPLWGLFELSILLLSYQEKSKAKVVTPDA